MNVNISNINNYKIFYDLSFSEYYLVTECKPIEAQRFNLEIKNYNIL